MNSEFRSNRRKRPAVHGLLILMLSALLICACLESGEDRRRDRDDDDEYDPADVCDEIFSTCEDTYFGGNASLCGESLGEMDQCRLECASRKSSCEEIGECLFSSPATSQVVADYCGASQADGDGSVVDGDAVLPDGDLTVDGDNPSDGDDPTDGDDLTDGDDPTDGDEPTDGDDPTDGDEPTECSGNCDANGATFCIDGDNVCMCFFGQWMPSTCDSYCELLGQSSNGCSEDACVCGSGTDGDDPTDGDEQPGGSRGMFCETIPGASIGYNVMCVYIGQIELRADAESCSSCKNLPAGVSTTIDLTDCSGSSLIGGPQPLDPLDAEMHYAYALIADGQSASLTILTLDTSQVTCDQVTYQDILDNLGKKNGPVLVVEYPLFLE